MNKSQQCFFRSSIGKKQIMATSGLLLCGFLISHLIGNCLIYAGADTYNHYSHMLITNPLLVPAEIILLLIFLSHIGLAFRLTVENHQARPQKYFVKTHTGRGANFASSTMPYTGLIIFMFLIWHLVMIKFGTHYSTTVEGVEMRDLYRLLQEHFSHPLNVVGYVFSVCALGVHVGHGFWSAFQSLGINHPRYTPKIKLISRLFGVAMALGYSALPLYMYLQGGK